MLKETYRKPESGLVSKDRLKVKLRVKDPHNDQGPVMDGGG